MRKLHNAQDVAEHFVPYVILMDWVEKDDNYGVYVGQTRKPPEDRFAQHKRGENAGRNVEDEAFSFCGPDAISADNLLKANTRRMYEGAVHHCLASIKADGFKKAY